MEHSISDAIVIMIVGMATVFFILWIVVMIGNTLIRLSNKFWPEAASIKKTIQTTTVSSDGTIAAIVAAVDVATHGKGKITKISKL